MIPCHISTHLPPESFNLIQPRTVSRSIDRQKLLLIGFKKWLQQGGGMGSGIIPDEKNERLRPHVTPGNKITFYLHGPLVIKDLIESFAGRVNDTPEQILDSILSRREDSILLVNGLIPFPKVWAPMNLGFIIVNEHCLFWGLNRNDAGDNPFHITACQFSGFGFFFSVSLRSRC